MSFGLREYVWDRVWEGPAIVVGVDEKTDLHTVVEIVLPNQKFGRTAKRWPADLCRYVKLIVPEDEAEVAETLTGTAADILPESVQPLADSFAKRVLRAREKRGIVGAGIE